MSIESEELDFYEGALDYDCTGRIFGSDEFLCELRDPDLSKCFIAVFDPKVSKRQMMEEIIEAVKCSFREDEE